MIENKNKIFLCSFMFFFISCEIKSKAPIILNKTPLIKMDVKDKKKEFDSFLKLFNNDTTYQLNSVIFPLPWFNEVNGDTLYLNKEDYDFLELKDDFGNYIEDSKTKIKIEEKLDDFVVNLFVEDSGVRIYFYFIFNNGWKLAKVIDSST